MAEIPWWLVHSLLFIKNFWLGSAFTILIVESVQMRRVAVRWRLWRAVTWLPRQIFDWRPQ